MNVILSRKGMDSGSGGIPSLILPDGVMLSLPIPDAESGLSYESLSYKGQSLRDLIQQVSPSFPFSQNETCHLDPDIYPDLDGRPAGWCPAFGQCGSSGAHLDRMGVKTGDLFLFYGMYRQTEYRPDGKLRYCPGAPVRHIIYGYLRVGDILRVPAEIKSRCPRHPHAVHSERRGNRLYIPDACGTFSFHDSLLLTKPGQPNRSLWSLPAFFGMDGITISWHGGRRPVLKDGRAELNVARRGQEFVIQTDTGEARRHLTDWTESLLRHVRVPLKPQE